MIERIDLFLPPDKKSRYGVLPHFTVKMAEAFKRAGVRCRLLKAEKNNPKPFLEALYNDPPDCTLSFNGLLPDSQGQFFCDMIRIPHVACLIDSPTQFISLANSPYTIITSPDRFGCEFFKGLNCQNVFFMPHAIEREVISDEVEKNRPYDVTMLSSCIDFEAIAELWPSKYPKEVCEAMYEAIEINLSDQETSCIQAFVQTMDQKMETSKVVPGILNYPEIIDQIEMYAKGKERIELIKSIKDAQIHIFGQPLDLWKKYLKAQPNIVFHEPVDFDQALNIMSQSKILLNSCAWLKDGIHERILAGLARGALVLTNQNIYLREHFLDGQNIAFYEMGKWDQINKKINDYLSQPEKIKQIAFVGRQIVKTNHTWDHRVKILLRELPQALNRIGFNS